MLNIVLFGPPGSGKGTHSAKLVEKYNLVHFSTGDILRSEIAAQTELGMLAKSVMDKGELVSDKLVIDMMRNKISQNKDKNGLVFDGFPRTTEQAAALDKLLAENNLSVSAMIMLDVEREELVTRLQKRSETSGRADDADIRIINNRIDVYNRQTLPIAEYYKKQNKFQNVNGMGSIDDIFDRIVKVIENL